MRQIPVRTPVAAIILACILASFGGYVYFFRLKIISDRRVLVNPRLEANRSYQKYLTEFGDDKFLVLVLSSTLQEAAGALPALPDKSQRQAMKQAAARWAELLRQRSDLFPKILERIDWDALGPLALLYVPKQALDEMLLFINDKLPEIQTWSQNPTLDHLLSILSKYMQVDSLPGDSRRLPMLLGGLNQFFKWLQLELQQTGSNLKKPLDLKNELPSVFSNGAYDRDGFFFTNDGRLLTVFANIHADPNRQNQYAEGMQFAEQALRTALRTLPDSLNITGGLAGVPALEYEEMKTTRRDFTRSTLIALLGVTLLFAFGFGNLLRPALATLCLCLAIGMTFGFVYLFIGHLNLLAMVFTVILVALGIDFSIHFVTHYEQALNAGHSPAQAIEKTYHTIGSALWMGGLTTGVAFLSAYFTEFSGLSELGIIAGAGLLICLSCMILIYPAMLFLLDTRFPKIVKSFRLRSMAEILPLQVPFEQTPRNKLSLFLTAAILLVSAGYFFGQYDFDTNLLNLQALEGKAKKWQRLLLATDDRTNFAISLHPDRPSMEQTRAKLLVATEFVRRTESLYPAEEAQKRQLLQAIHKKLARVNISNSAEVSLFNVKRRLWNVRQTVRKYRQSSEKAKAALAELAGTVDGLYRTLNDLPAEVSLKRLQSLQSDLIQAVRTLLKEVLVYLDPPPLTLAQIPLSLRERFQGKDGSVALLIYPANNTWNRRELEEFVTRTRKIDPNIFGEIVALYENGRSLIRSFLYSATYALIAILILLLLWTRSMRSTLFSLLPLISSVGVLLGLMQWLPGKIYWNFANFFALPILIGIGVDSGIHLVRAWKQNSIDIYHGAAKAVLFSSLTTMIGFGILATSDHLGIGSLGLILFIGITLCLISSLTLLPAALNLFMKKGDN
ncbi:MAG: MMPL family transporter [bacterium]